VFEFWNPVYVIRDVELIKQLTIKEFDNFPNHRSMIDENVDTFFGKSLFIINDQKWRDMRSTLSPAFTGSKMRHMLHLISEISNDYMKQLKEIVGDEKDIEFKDLATKYANDVIAKCAFGLSINSLADPQNEFFKTGQTITQFPFKQQLKFFGYSTFPKFMNVSELKSF
jgi:cytochrome P450 family 9